MRCFRPLKAWKLANGSVWFGAEKGDCQPLLLRCGQCIGCRLSRSRAWAIRCMHEAQMHQVNSFVTLTYDDKHYGPSLVYSDFQKFMRRVRKRKGKTRFFVCGEYGDLTQRRHFHALLFGQGFSDLRPIGKDLYRSLELEELWPNGFSSIGGVTYESAAYVASYCVKKVNGPRADYHYSRVDAATGEYIHVLPELAHMSLRPHGIGYTWFLKYWRDVYEARDGVCMRGGQTIPAPRYYDKLLEESCPDLKDWRDWTRYVQSGQFVDDCTPERLAVREKVATAQHQHHHKAKL